jgi:hypothetical protein
VTALLLTFVAGCGNTGAESYRYRMTVYVDTPAGPRSGSSVIEVTTAPPGPLSNSAFRRQVRGEAVAVDLPGGTLFALLRTPTEESAAGSYAGHAYSAVLPKGYDWRTGVKTLQRQTSPAELSAEYLPKFVRFRRPGDVTSVEAIDPADLSTSFGAGVRLNRVTIQITHDAVTSTIRRRLPSFESESGYTEWLTRLAFDDPRRVTISDFVIG